MPQHALPDPPQAASNPRAERLLWFTIGAWLIGYTLWLVALHWGFTTDDAYISLRYAKNLATGAGLVWNQADGPLEGYSNFTFVLLGAWAEWAGFDPVSVIKTAGLVGLLITLASLYGISRLWLSPVGSLVAPLALVAYYGTIFWATSGLETAVFQALAAFSCLCFLRGTFHRTDDRQESVSLGGDSGLRLRANFDRRLLLVSGLTVFLATLTRPEAPLFMAVFATVWGVLWLRNTDERQRLLASSLWFLAPFTFLLLGYSTWKLAYFGTLLPNSFACKLESGSDGTKIFREFLEIAAVPLALAGASRKLRHPAVLALILPSLIYLYLLFGADPVIGHFSRLGLPAFGLLLPAAAAGTMAAVAGWTRVPSGTIERGAAVILALSLIAFGLRHDDKLGAHASRYRTRMDARERIGRWIADTGGPDTSFVVGDAGIVSWTAHRGVSVDAYCLNNPTMTREEGGRNPATFAHRVFETIKPEFIVVPNLDPTELAPRPSYGVFPAIVSHPGFSAYRLDRIETSAPGDGFHYFVYRRATGAPGTSATSVSSAAR